jgi:hypothetical protein
MQKLWTCEPEWPGETVFIVCGGPSLMGFDFERLRGRRVIAINRSIHSVPFADLLFFGDRRFWHDNRFLIKFERSRVVTNSPTVNDPEIRQMLKQKPPPALVDDRTVLPMDYTSLMPAMQLAVHRGARRIVLLGADCRPGKNGRHHHHEEYTYPVKPDIYDLQRNSLMHCVRPLAKRGIDVINTSEKSALPWWPKVPIDQVLKEIPT